MGVTAPPVAGLAAAALILLAAVEESGAANVLTLINPWYKTACIPQQIKESDHYICTSNGTILCLPGWSGEHASCSVPICRPQCVPHQGNCTAPNQCSCEIGWTVSLTYYFGVIIVNYNYDCRGGTARCACASRAA